MKTTVNVSDTVKNRKSTKTSKKASTAEAMLKAALDAAQVEYPPLSQLVKSPKKRPHPAVHERKCARTCRLPAESGTVAEPDCSPDARWLARRGRRGGV